MRTFFVGFSLGILICVVWIWCMMAYLTRDAFVSITPLSGTLLVAGVFGVSGLLNVFAIFVAEET